MPPKRRPGPIEESVRADLASLDKSKASGFHATLSQMAVRLARAYDEFSGADMAKLARLNQELRATLAAVRGDDDGNPGQSGASLPPPVWDPPKS